MTEGTKAIVVIPTKNGGRVFQLVLQALSDQEVAWRYDILVVDSSSTDGTLEYCRQRGIRVHSIVAEDFGHGRTRNLAISLTEGEFVVLLTQDALPASRQWLSKLVAAVEQRDDVAGAFGRQLPYPEADPYTARDLSAHFDKFLKWPRMLRLDDAERYRSDERYRRVLHFFSNSNACIRRSVWEKFPFPDVDYAEDQHWARTVIEAGYAKAYCDEAAVFHSHQYSVVESARRAFDEAIALKAGFNFDPCPTLMTALTESFRRTQYDWTYSIGLGKALEHVYWMLRSPVHNFFQQFGFYLGGRHDRLPDWLIRRISLDRATKDGRWRPTRT